MGLFGRRSDKGTPFEWLVVGLGNPGPKYARTRHNVGEDVVQLLARRQGETLRGGRDNALVAESRIGDVRVVLAFPITFMNNSGQSVSALVRRYRIEDPGRIVVVHDELDLEPGVVKVKAGGGLAGHNGLRSITQHLKTQDYLRIRIGVGKPPSKERGAGHVLAKLGTAERILLDGAVEIAADAAATIVTEGVDAAMRTVNSR